MKVIYERRSSVTTDIDIDKIVDLVFSNEEFPEGEYGAIMMFMDNIEYYFVQAGFLDYDSLSECQIDDICEEVNKLIHKRYEIESFNHARDSRIRQDHQRKIIN